MMIKIMSADCIAEDETRPIDIYSNIEIDEMVDILKSVDCRKDEICEKLDELGIKYEWNGGLNCNMMEVITYYNRYDGLYKIIRVQERISGFEKFEDELELSEVYFEDLVTTKVIRVEKEL